MKNIILKRKDINRKIKDELEFFFSAPEPQRKQIFLRQMTRKQRGRGLSAFSMLALQCHYISPAVWLVSAAFFLFVLVISCFVKTEESILTSAIVPFLVMLSVTESMRSYQNGMEELEMTTRYSLKTVIFMRLLVLGMGNLILLLATVFLLGNQLFFNLVYLFTPYFLTAAGSLWIVRKFAGKESNYLCFGFALLVAIAVYGSLTMYRFIYEEQYLGVWCLLLLFFAGLSVREGRSILKQTEALA